MFLSDVPDEADVSDDADDGKNTNKEKIFKTSDDVAFYRYVEQDLLHLDADVCCLFLHFTVTFETADAGSKPAAPSPVGHHEAHGERGKFPAAGV